MKGNCPTVEKKTSRVYDRDFGTKKKKKKKALVFLLIHNILQTPSKAFSQCGKTCPTCCNQGKTNIHPWVDPFFGCGDFCSLGIHGTKP